MCLLAKDYRAALSVLADEVLALAPPDSYALKPREVLRFFYYGGMIYTGVKNFGKAVEFFKMVKRSVDLSAMATLTEPDSLLFEIRRSRSLR